MVDTSADFVTVAIVDIDGCPPQHSSYSSTDVAPNALVRQLETIFMNFEGHPAFNRLFESSGGTSRLLPSLISCDDVIAACTRECKNFQE